MMASDDLSSKLYPDYAYRPPKAANACGPVTPGPSPRPPEGGVVDEPNWMNRLLKQSHDPEIYGNED